ncbi:hypothetical protein CEP54_016126 [Fusarium duplospermum]|uniref:Uncharacterized protein n=1 Tax=Fusarium duplospermum TaxID=1325734 RepID=A0A428NI36_9HYPO|nr:hypothetical protein CEP54_016126 [Fusarium duplospermum]
MAADEVFDGTNKRWIVDLYSDDLSDDLRTLFIEEYEYQKVPDDGEFYCKIRGYQGYNGEENPFFERIWLGRLSALSKNRRDLLDQLLRHKKFTDAFDALMAIPALFCGFRLTVVHQVISMRCEEPNLHYLKQILRIWSDICGGDPEAMRLVDRATIERVQGTAPGAFSTDHDDLLCDLKSGRIFGNFSEPQRGEIWPRVCAISRQCLIPSLFTFFEDRKFLSTAADCMRRLTHVSAKDTISSRLDEMFQDTNQQTDRCTVQISDTAYATITGDGATRFDLGCRQLWLAAFREFRELPADLKKKDVLAKARKKADETTLFEFASLAYRLGFESKEIGKVIRTSPDLEVARRTLLSARKPGKYRYPNFEHCIQQMIDIFATAQPIPATETSRNSEMNQCVEPPMRWGIPHDTDHDRDQAQLFLPNILMEFKTSQTRVTSFFIRRSVYLAYFGLPLSMAGFLTDDHELTHHFDLGVGLAYPAERAGHGSETQPNETAAVQEEQSRLDQLKELSNIEQAKLDHLRELIQEQQRHFEQLTLEAETLAQNQLVLRENEEDDEQPGGKEPVQSDVMDATRETSQVQDLVMRPSERNASPPAKRVRRITRFDFDRVQEGNPSDQDNTRGSTSSRRQPIRIEFVTRQDTGQWAVSDTILIDPSDSSPVQRTAAKYLRKQFCLFDTHFNNLIPKTCFEKVTANGTNTILVVPISQVKSIGNEGMVASADMA